MSKQKFLKELKKTAGSATELVLPVGKPIEAILRPVATTKHTINHVDVTLLSEWRNRFVKSFLTEFHSHDERTIEWLLNTVSKDTGKILFMIDTINGETIGHVGLGFIDWEKGYVEADAIVRGGIARKGLMKLILQHLLQWANNTLDLNNSWVRVRSDNPAVYFYQKVGFVESKRIPLSKIEDASSVTWYEDENGSEEAPALVYMKYSSP